MTTAASNSRCLNQAAQCHPQTDAQDPPTPPMTDQDRHDAADRVLERAGNDVRAACEMFKAPQAGGHES